MPIPRLRGALIIRLEHTDEQGKRHKLHVGYVPVVYDGEIKAVITLNYNYDLFVEKTDNMIAIALIIFDSLDGQVHPGEEQNKDLLYYEFARIRLDGTDQLYIALTGDQCAITDIRIKSGLI